MMSGDMKGEQVDYPDQHEGAVEGDRPTDPQQGNDNARDALDPDGLPADDTKIAEDVLGANLDDTQG